MYNYQHTWNAIVDGRSVILGSGFDYARDLLSEDDFRDVLQRRYHDLYRLAVELDVLGHDVQMCELEIEDGVRCVGFNPLRGQSIIGNLLQQNFFIQYDRRRSLLGFAPANCSLIIA